MSAVDLTDSHLDAIDAQIELLKIQVLGQIELLSAQLAALKAYRKSQEPPPKADISVPEPCQAYPADACGLRDEDAQMSRASFAAPHAWTCRGCDRRSDDGRTLVAE